MIKKIFFSMFFLIFLAGTSFAAGSSSDSGSTESHYDKAVKLIKAAKKLEKKGKTEKVIKRYGMIGLCFHTTCYICSLGCVYAALRSGLDFPESTAFILENLNVSEDAGMLAVAWAVNASLTSIPRTVLTVVATPIIAKRFFGYKDAGSEK